MIVPLMMALNDPQEDRPAVHGVNHNAQQNQQFTGSVDRHRIQAAKISIERLWKFDRFLISINKGGE